MPFVSEKQRRLMWAKHPEIARRWSREYPNQGKLPMYKSSGVKAKGHKARSGK